MPIYEYACGKCEHVFEARLEHSAAPAPKCPSCGATKVNKLLSTFAVHGSGSGGPSLDRSALPPCQGGTAPGCGAGACGFA